MNQPCCCYHVQWKTFKASQSKWMRSTATCNTFLLRKPSRSSLPQ